MKQILRSIVAVLLNSTLAFPLVAQWVQAGGPYPKTVVSYQLPVASDVRLSVHDLLGREVAVLVNEKKAPGSYEVKFDGSGLASGVYLYRLTARPTDGRGAAEFTQAKKLLLVR